MNDPDVLHVWCEDRLVGLLWRDQSSPQGMGFRYTEDWVGTTGFAISQRLPLTSEAFPAEAGGSAQQFFSNLLPEGGQEPVLFETSKSRIRISICCAPSAGTARGP